MGNNKGLFNLLLLAVMGYALYQGVWVPQHSPAVVPAPGQPTVTVDAQLLSEIRDGFAVNVDDHARRNDAFLWGFAYNDMGDKVQADSTFNNIKTTDVLDTFMKSTIDYQLRTGKPSRKYEGVSTAVVKRLRAVLSDSAGGSVTDDIKAGPFTADKRNATAKLLHDIGTACNIVATEPASK